MTASTAAKNAWTRPVIIGFLAFIGLGLTAGLLGVAWPSIREQFHLVDSDTGVLFLFQTLTYSLASFYIGRMMARFTSGVTLLAGTIIMVVCLFAVAVSSTWIMVVLFLMIFGFGNGMVDAGLNMYIATYHTAQQMNFLHACFGIGITIGPLIMTLVLQQKLGWQAGYAIVGAILISVVLMLLFTRRVWRSEGFASADKTPVQRASFAGSLRVPAVWFGMATFLAYVGLEIGIGQWAYTLLTESRGVPTEIAGPLVSLYWGTFTVGRILWGFIANRFDIEKVLRYCMLGALAGTILLWWNVIPEVGYLGLMVAGFAQAPVFPMLMAGTEHRVGSQHAENTISMQMSAVGIGTAFLPGLIGAIGKNFGLETMAATFVVMGVIVVIFHEMTLLRRTEQPVLSSAGD
jgi:fucose permease